MIGRNRLYPLIVGALGLAAALSAPATGAAGGQEARSAAPGDTIHVASNALEAASLAFAGALADVSGDAMRGLLAPDDIRLHLGGSGHTGLSARQAVASLTDFMRGYAEGVSAVTRAAPVEGSSDRGFAEIVWTARASGTSHEIHRVLFLGLVRQSSGWRVDEVRVLR